MRMIAAVLAVAVLVVPTWGQEAPKPGPEHEWLKKLEGTWENTMTAGGATEKGTTTYKMDLGGFWLSSTMESQMQGQKWTGKGMEGYCPIKKKYVTIWTDSMGPSPVILTGDYDKEKKTLTQTGDGPGMDGKVATYKSVTVFPDADSMTMTMWVGDGKEPMFSVAYKRKK
jgi:Protein of unknown function (DUF1579)